MSEPTPTISPTTVACQSAPPTASPWRERLVALSGRLADLLAQLSSTQFAASESFLRDADVAIADDAALARLVAGYRLEPLEVDLLLLAAMPEQDEGYAGVLQLLHPRSEPRPTAGLAARLLTTDPASRTALRRLLLDGAAVQAGLLSLHDDGPFFNRSLELGAGLWPLAQGCASWPAPLRPVIEPPERLVGSGYQSWLAREDTARVVAALQSPAVARGDGSTSPVFLVVADELRTARDRARALVAAAGRTAAVLELDSRQARAHQAAIGTQAFARDMVAIVVVHATAEPPPTLPGFAASPAAVVLCSTRDSMRIESTAGPSRPVWPVDCPRLVPTDLRTVWAEALPDLADHAETLAAQFPLEPGWIREIGEDLRARQACAESPQGFADVLLSVRTRAGANTRPGVRLRRPSVDWKQLILPPERKALLREAVARVRHQSRVLDDWGFLAERPGSRGVRMLFCGPPGTGKTFSAEVMARELETDLMIVDLSRLVSKWIGETEKNLAEVFAAAERSRAILLFDEADALFGKRTEVSDAHDRYANLETAYLLGRLEQYEGLAILATNLRRNVDAAFMRRLEFVVEYERPRRSERLELWKAHLPTGAPLAADVDLHELADFYPLVGGLIRNAAVAAAFLAASGEKTTGDPPTRITRELLLRAIRHEYEKSGAAFPGQPPRPSRP